MKLYFQVIRAFVLVCCLMSSFACSNMGGGTTGTGLNFRDGKDKDGKTAPKAGEILTGFFVQGTLRSESGRVVKNSELLVASTVQSLRVKADGKGEFQFVIAAALGKPISVRKLGSDGDPAEILVRAGYDRKPYYVKVIETKDGSLHVEEAKSEK